MSRLNEPCGLRGKGIEAIYIEFAFFLDGGILRI